MPRPKRTHSRMRTENRGRTLQIQTDGRTLWINGVHGLLGRFAPAGIDVHAEPGSDKHCLDCGPHGEKPWERFVAAMKLHHGVDLDYSWQPEWSRACAK